MKKITPKSEFKIRVVTMCVFLAIITALLGTLTGCNKYKVLSYLRGNLYHIHNAKTKNSEVIMTNDSLIIGNYYKLKDINIIESPYYKPKSKNKIK